MQWMALIIFFPSVSRLYPQLRLWLWCHDAPGSGSGLCGCTGWCTQPQGNRISRDWHYSWSCYTRTTVHIDRSSNRRFATHVYKVFLILDKILDLHNLYVVIFDQCHVSHCTIWFQCDKWWILGRHNSNVGLVRGQLWGELSHLLQPINYLGCQVSWYIAEFYNTLTNLAMIVPACYGIYKVRKHHLERRWNKHD